MRSMFEVISRGEALSQGLKRFFNGVPCKHGHLAQRNASNGCCCECNRLRSKDIMARINSTPEGRKRNTERDRRRRSDPTNRAKHNETSRLIRQRVYATEEGKAKHRAWLNTPEGRASVNASNAKRRATILAQTPAWVSEHELQRIKALYKEAARLTAATGITHHVDHILPLQGELVCGLHCLSNLQILTQAENCSKSNRFDPVAA